MTTAQIAERMVRQALAFGATQPNPDERRGVATALTREAVAAANTSKDRDA